MVFLVFAAGSLDSDDSKPSGAVAPGNTVILDAFKGTTLQKETHKNQSVGKIYEFCGKVHDVTSPGEAEIMIDSENYASVKFVQDISGLQKGDTIRFAARLDDFGTGILLNHQMSQARLSP